MLPRRRRRCLDVETLYPRDTPGLGDRDLSRVHQEIVDDYIALRSVGDRRMPGTEPACKASGFLDTDLGTVQAALARSGLRLRRTWVGVW